MVPILMPLNYVVALVQLHNVSGGGGSVLAARFIGLLMHKVSHCCCVNGLAPVNSSCWQVDILRLPVLLMMYFVTSWKT